MNAIPLSAVPLSASIYMNERFSKYLLAGDKFMLEMYLKQPGLTYSACGPLTKNK